MRQAYDVVIAGGGVVGSSVAYWLAADPDFDGSVLVVEPDPTYAACATTRSWGGLRQQFSHPDNIRMSMFGIAFARQAAEVLAVDGEGPDLGFHENGYLFLASADGLPILQKNVETQKELGCDVELMAPDALAARFPWINPNGLAAGCFGPRNEGWIDPHALLQGFRRKAISLGVTYAKDAVAAVSRDGSRVSGVSLRDGSGIACGVLVNAAGPRAGDIARFAGTELPVRPRKRMTYVFDCREDLSSAPLTIDTNGVTFRPESGQYLGIVSPPEDQDPDSDDLELEYDVFEEVIWPTLAHRVPAFEAIKMSSAWAGHYDFNTFDHNAILGPHPEIAGLMFCNGFSGHGIQQSPAAGRAVAELIAHGAYRSLDLSVFAYDRIPANRPVLEANIV